MVKSQKKIFVGLSGGVDSAVSAALLLKKGYDVVGLFAFIALPGYPCTAGQDRREALRVAAHLQIPLEETDLSGAYRHRVFEEALRAYQHGETPNPDALCNREIKFGLLFDYAIQKGADAFATGHYARTKTVRGETHLLAGRDRDKDQSYFLWAVPEERLAKTIFPVGQLHKSEVRKLAKKFALPNAERKDSQGLCFIGDISLEEVLTKELKPSLGDVLNLEGVSVGSHHGATLYTIGQRHGFELRSQGKKNMAPHYVVAKNVEHNTITVESESGFPISPRQNCSRNVIYLREENWIGNVESGLCKARLRYRQKLMPAVLDKEDRCARLQDPQMVPVGQSLVAYRGERCLGGGIIDHL